MAGKPTTGYNVWVQGWTETQSTGIRRWSTVHRWAWFAVQTDAHEYMKLLVARQHWHCEILPVGERMHGYTGMLHDPKLCKDEACLDRACIRAKGMV